MSELWAFVSHSTHSSRSHALQPAWSWWDFTLCRHIIETLLRDSQKVADDTQRDTSSFKSTLERLNLWNMNWIFKSWEKIKINSLWDLKKFWVDSWWQVSLWLSNHSSFYVWCRKPSRQKNTPDNLLEDVQTSNKRKKQIVFLLTQLRANCVYEVNLTLSSYAPVMSIHLCCAQTTSSIDWKLSSKTT